MNRMPRLLAAALACTITAGLAIGCGGPKSPATPVSEESVLLKAGAPIHLLHEDLKKIVASEIQESSRLDDGRMSIMVVLRNRTDKLQHIQTRTVFKDERGISTGDETPWHDLYLDPLQMQTVRADSKTGAVEQYTVEIRIPRKPRGKKA